MKDIIKIVSLCNLGVLTWVLISGERYQITSTISYDTYSILIILWVLVLFGFLILLEKDKEPKDNFFLQRGISPLLTDFIRWLGVVFTSPISLNIIKLELGATEKAILGKGVLNLKRVYSDLELETAFEKFTESVRNRIPFEEWVFKNNKLDLLIQQSNGSFVEFNRNCRRLYHDWEIGYFQRIAEKGNSGWVSTLLEFASSNPKVSLLLGGFATIGAGWFLYTYVLDISAIWGQIVRMSSWLQRNSGNVESFAKKSVEASSSINENVGGANVNIEGLASQVGDMAKLLAEQSASWNSAVLISTNLSALSPHISALVDVASSKTMLDAVQYDWVKKASRGLPIEMIRRIIRFAQSNPHLFDPQQVQTNSGLNQSIGDDLS